METFIHPTVQLAANVKIGKNVYIGPYCVIGFPGYQERKKKTIEQFKGIDTEPTVIGNNVKIYSHTVICQNTIINDNCRIDSHTYVGEDTIIGKESVIEYGARVYDSVIIENNCTISGFISNDCKISHHAIVQGDLIHKFKDVDKSTPEASPTVGCHAFIGRKAIVIGNISIAEYSYLGAGSLLTKSTLPGRLYLGSPAVDKGAAPKVYRDVL